jgi:hypothetical protein
MSPNSKTDLPIQVQEVSRTPNRIAQNRTSPWDILIKIVSTEQRKNIEVCMKEKTINV